MAPHARGLQRSRPEASRGAASVEAQTSPPFSHVFSCSLTKVALSSIDRRQTLQNPLPEAHLENGVHTISPALFYLQAQISMSVPSLQFKSQHGNHKA